MFIASFIKQKTYKLKMFILLTKKIIGIINMAFYRKVLI